MTGHMKSATGEKALRILRTIVLIVVVFLAMVWMRAFYGSMKAYEEGEKYLEMDQFVQAITFFDRSIHWYTPYNPYVEKSAKRLWEVGERSRQDGDIKLALIALRAIRGGFYSARSFYTPGKNWIRMSEKKIHELEKMEKAQKGLQDEAKMETAFGERSQEVPGPNPGWSVLVVLGFLGWVGAVIGLIWFSWTSLGKAEGYRSLSILWGCLALIFFILWIVAMFQA